MAEAAEAAEVAEVAEVTEVTEVAEVTEVDEMAEVTEMAEVNPGPVLFNKVNELRPGTKRYTLRVRVVGRKIDIQRDNCPSCSQARPMRIAECLVGDETGVIVFYARNKQVDLMKEGKMLTLRNAKIGVYKGSMRLAIDNQGHIEVTKEPEYITVRGDNNISLIELELVPIVKKE